MYFVFAIASRSLAATTLMMMMDIPRWNVTFVERTGETTDRGISLSFATEMKRVRCWGSKTLECDVRLEHEGEEEEDIETKQINQ